jgi:6-phosphofructokinase
MSIGILTSGGDCPGLNAVIRGAVLKGTQIYNQKFVGFRHGWRGVVEGDIIPLERKDIQGISKQGGTILGTSRTNPFEANGGADVVRANMERLGVDSLIAIGGEGTLAAAKRLTDAGIKIVGVPKTTMTSQPPTTPSVSTPPCRSRRMPWTASAPPVTHMAAAWWPR